MSWSAYAARKHIASVRSRLHTEVERKQQSLSFAKLCMKARLYSEASKHLLYYLQLKPSDFRAHKLLGESYEKEGELEKAIAAYRKSLDVWKSQKDLVVKVGELYCQMPDVPPAVKKEWVQRMEEITPRHFALLRLKAHVSVVNGGTPFEGVALSPSSDPEEHVVIVNKFASAGELLHAHIYCQKVRENGLFLTDPKWNRTALDIHEKYLDFLQKEESSPEHILREVCSCLELLSVVVELEAKTSHVGWSQKKMALLLRKYDRHLGLAHRCHAMLTAVNTFAHDIALKELCGRFYAVAAQTMMLHSGGPKHPCHQLAVACLFASASTLLPQTPPGLSGEVAAEIAGWHSVSLTRCCVVVHQLLLVLAHYSAEAVQACVKRYSSNDGKTAALKQLLVDSVPAGSVPAFLPSQSFLVSDQTLAATSSLDPPSQDFLEDCDREFVEQFRENLPALVWLALTYVALDQKPPLSQWLPVCFPSLPVSTPAAIVKRADADSLCLRDVEAFFLLAVEDYIGSAGVSQDTGRVERIFRHLLTEVPCWEKVSLLEHLSDTWTKFHLLCRKRNLSAVEVFGMKKSVSSALSLVRALPPLKLSISRLTFLARHFKDQAEEAAKTDDGSSPRQRARNKELLAHSCYYWQALLDLSGAKPSPSPGSRKYVTPKNSSRLFSSKSPGDSIHAKREKISKEVEQEALMTLGHAALMKSDCEQALSLYDKVSTPAAAWNRSQIYRFLASKEDGEMQLSLLQNAANSITEAISRTPATNKVLQEKLESEQDEIDGMLGDRRHDSPSSHGASSFFLTPHVVASACRTSMSEDHAVVERTLPRSTERDMESLLRERDTKVSSMEKRLRRLEEEVMEIRRIQKTPQSSPTYLQPRSTGKTYSSGASPRSYASPPTQHGMPVLRYSPSPTAGGAATSNVGGRLPGPQVSPTGVLPASGVGLPALLQQPTSTKGSVVEWGVPPPSSLDPLRQLVPPVGALTRPAASSPSLFSASASGLAALKQPVNYQSGVFSQQASVAFAPGQFRLPPSSSAGLPGYVSGGTPARIGPSASFPPPQMFQFGHIENLGVVGKSPFQFSSPSPPPSKAPAVVGPPGVKLPGGGVASRPAAPPLAKQQQPPPVNLAQIPANFSQPPPANFAQIPVNFSRPLPPPASVAQIPTDFTQPPPANFVRIPARSSRPPASFYSSNLECKFSAPVPSGVGLLNLVPSTMAAVSIPAPTSMATVSTLVPSSVVGVHSGKNPVPIFQQVPFSYSPGITPSTTAISGFVPKTQTSSAPALSAISLVPPAEPIFKLHSTTPLQSSSSQPTSVTSSFSFSLPTPKLTASTSGGSALFPQPSTSADASQPLFSTLSQSSRQLGGSSSNVPLLPPDSTLESVPSSLAPSSLFPGAGPVVRSQGGSSISPFCFSTSSSLHPATGTYPLFASTSTFPAVASSSSAFAPSFSALSVSLGGSTAAPSTPERSNDEDASFDAGAEFRPVISLPEVVDRRSGEEEDEVVFAHKAKLYRFESSSKQWKERGIGTIKVLRHTVSGRYRVLMRRDQILKICCHHHVTPDMELRPYGNEGRAWVWFAPSDFADEVTRPENFVVRFKESDTAKEFQDAFLEATRASLSEQSESAESADNEDDSIQQESTSRDTSSLFPKSVQSTASWSCEMCWISNKVGNAVCAACSTPRSGTAELSEGGPVATTTPSATTGPGSPWQLGGLRVNDGSAREGATGLSLLAGSANLATTAAAVSGGVALPPGMSLSALSGTSGVHGSATGGVRISSLEGISLSSLTGTTSVSTTAPVSGGLKLPPRASLFALAEASKPGEMATGGNGVTQGMAPLSQQMAEPTLTRAPASIFDKSRFGMELPSAPSAVIRLSMDDEEGEEEEGSEGGDRGESPEGADVHGSFRDTSRDEEDEKEDRSEVEREESATADVNGPLGSAGVHFEVRPDQNYIAQDGKRQVVDDVAEDDGRELSEEEEEEDNSMEVTEESDKEDANDVVIVAVTEPPRDLAKRAEDHQLPAGFYLYETKPPCPGCRGCDDQLNGPHWSEQPNTTTPATVIDAAARPDDVGSSSAQAAPPPLKGSGLFAGHLQSSALSFGDLASHPSGFSWQLNEPDEGAKGALAVSNKPLFGDGGSPVADGPDGEPADAHFTPLVSLPVLDKIETGEEGEDVLFCQRTKLFRFDSAAQQWKDRGIGEIKVLVSRASRKGRVVMRREQILKLCCNHVLSPELSLVPHAGSDRAWTWFAPSDYSEGEPRPEQFVAKFKNEKIAADFREAFLHGCRSHQKMDGLERRTEDGKSGSEEEVANQEESVCNEEVVDRESCADETKNPTAPAEKVDNGGSNVNERANGSAPSEKVDDQEGSADKRESGSVCSEEVADRESCAAAGREGASASGEKADSREACADERENASSPAEKVDDRGSDVEERANRSPPGEKVDDRGSDVEERANGSPPGEKVDGRESRADAGEKPRACGETADDRDSGTDDGESARGENRE